MSNSCKNIIYNTTALMKNDDDDVRPVVYNYYIPTHITSHSVTDSLSVSVPYFSFESILCKT